MSNKTKRSTKSEIVPVDGKSYLDAAEIKPGSKGAVVAQILQTMDIASRVDNDSIESLQNALQEYLQVCMLTNTSVTNTGLYAALGVSDDTISKWLTGERRGSDPRYREFAAKVKAICAQYRELAAAEGKLHPTLTIWWQKNYDGFRDDPVIIKEVTDVAAPVDPEEIAKKYQRLRRDDSGERMEAERERRSITMPVYEEEEEENNE